MTEQSEFEGIDLPIPCRCGAKIAYSVNDEGNPNGVLHAMPMCAGFEERDPEQFLRWVREGRLS